MVEKICTDRKMFATLASCIELTLRTVIVEWAVGGLSREPGLLIANSRLGGAAEQARYHRVSVQISEQASAKRRRESRCRSQPRPVDSFF